MVDTGGKSQAYAGIIVYTLGVFVFSTHFISQFCCARTVPLTGDSTAQVNGAFKSSTAGAFAAQTTGASTPETSDTWNPTTAASTPQTTHACPVCGKHYVNEGSLRKHLAAHPETAHITSALRMWPCSICPAVFPHETGKNSYLQGCQLKTFFFIMKEFISIDGHVLHRKEFRGEQIHHKKKMFSLFYAHLSIYKA